MNKIDFFAILTVSRANPNGDPLNGNRPREDYEGYGEISDVCIKRKIRNRLQDMGEKIFVKMAERADDGFGSLSERASSTIKDIKDREDYARKACEEWIDVRGFGQVFAFKGKTKKEGVSVGVRGPISIHPAISVTPIDIASLQITKSVNSEPTDAGKKSSDTMGMKHRVEFGVYILKGSINSQLAGITGFDEVDAEKIHHAIITLFENDASTARPEGSMNVERVYWWKHNSNLGQYSTAQVHRSVDVKLKEGIIIPKSIEDYDINYTPLEGLEVDIFNA